VVKIPGCPDVVGTPQFVCCPSPSQACPPLTIDLDDDCTCDAAGNCTISGNAVIFNSSSTPVTPPLSLVVSTNPNAGSVTVPVTSPIPAQGMVSIPYSFPCTSGLCACPGGCTITATIQIPGCPAIVGTPQLVCCPVGPQKLCPTLTVKSVEGTCECGAYAAREGMKVICTLTTAHVVIVNTGSVDAGPFSIAIASDGVTGTASVPGVPAGGSKNVDVPLKVSRGVREGGCYDVTVTLKLAGCPDVVSGPWSVCCKVDPFLFLLVPGPGTDEQPAPSPTP